MNNRNSAKLLSCIIFALLLSACASAGKDFERPDAGSLHLGEASSTEITRQFGKPQSQAISDMNGQTVATLSYSYSVATPGSSFGGNIPTRSIVFHFWKDTLVGHQFVSSFDEDSTDFDPTLSGQLKIGETTEADVRRILGRPDGVFIYPIVEDETAKIYSYQYLRGEGGFLSVDFSSKSLSLTFDENGIVQDIDSSKMMQN